jgi:hypothetical protein
MPGEITKLGYFLHYLQLTQILARALDLLYKTSDRRNGPEKIARLEDKLRIWKQNLPRTPLDESLASLRVPGEAQTLSSLDLPVLSDSETFMSLWLRLIGELAMVLIHRPALTFDIQEPQFQKSLKACTDSSARIILILRQGITHRRLFSMWPSGPLMVACSALMLLYRGWLGQLFPFDESQQVDLPSIVRIAADLATRLSNVPDNQALGLQGMFPSLSIAPNVLTESSAFLNYLLNLTLQLDIGPYSLSRSSGFSDDMLSTSQGGIAAYSSDVDHFGSSFGSAAGDAISPPHLSSQLPESPLIIIPQDSPFWTPEDLDAINQMDFSEWMDPIPIPWDIAMST